MEPLLQTLQTYVETGGIAIEAAKRLHVAVRTVTYLAGDRKASSWTVAVSMRGGAPLAP